jgi:hypothetical protein
MLMSMEMYVLSERSLTSIQDWQRSIDTMGCAVQLATTVPFAKLHGALPVWLGQTISHFECSHWDLGDIFRTYSKVDFDQRWKYALAFRWGGDFDVAFSAYVAAAAYAKAVGGIIFDCQEGALISSQRAIEIANDIKQSKPVLEVAIRTVARDVVQKMKRRR